MRLIATLKDGGKGLTFSQFLNRKGIAHQVDVTPNWDWGSPDYGTATALIWVLEEDQVEEAQKWYNLFMENPHDPIFSAQQKIQTPPSPKEEPSQNPSEIGAPKSPWDGKKMGIGTRLILLACVLIFILTQLLTNTKEIPQNLPAVPIFSSPVEKVILF